MIQFDRLYECMFAAPIKDDYGQISAEILTVAGLRIQFKIEKTLLTEPNKAEISVYNLTPENRQRVARLGGKVILKCGYESTANLYQLFLGDIRTVSHIRDKVDWQTKVTSGDGERAIRYASINESFASGTPLAPIFEKIAKGMNQAIAVPTDLMNKTVGRGFTASGNCSEQLTTILQPLGYRWSIQDGVVQVLKDTETTPSLVPLLTPSTGLIGSPEIGENEKTKGPLIKAKCLLQGRILPGNRIEIRSSKYNGTIKVTQLVHSGDSAGEDWYTELEGIPL